MPIIPNFPLEALPQELVGRIAEGLPQKALKSLKRAYSKFTDVVEQQQVKRLRADFCSMEAALAPAPQAKPAVAGAAPAAKASASAANALPAVPQETADYDSDKEDTRTPSLGALMTRHEDIKRDLKVEPWAEPLRHELQARSVKLEQALRDLQAPLLDQEAIYRRRPARVRSAAPHAHLWNVP
jgi:hypothetical protein